jgi:DNA-binding response OmpR family regulator
VSDVAPRIFVVEDEKAFVDVYQKIFDIIDFEIADWAYSGEEAIEKYRSRTKDPDLIIMDHRLPGINGVETMLQILKIDRSAKILFVSADEKARKLSMDNGAVGFLLKPFSLAGFIAAVEENASGRAEPSR